MMIFLACGLTVLIETPVMALFGWRDRDELLIVVCANVVTNLLLNLSLMLIGQSVGGWIYAMEMLVVFAEYALYAQAAGRSRRLFAQTLLVNALSYSLGLLIF